MKRKVYEIFLNGDHVGTAYAWNTALKIAGKHACNYLAETVTRGEVTQDVVLNLTTYKGTVVWQSKSKKLLYKIAVKC